MNLHGYKKSCIQYLQLERVYQIVKYVNNAISDDDDDDDKSEIYEGLPGINTFVSDKK